MGCLLSLYYSAAAHNKLNNNDQALNDCFRSIEIDPYYSKAYGRLGYVMSLFSFEKKKKIFLDIKCDLFIIGQNT
jgi:hypothetical protein